MAWAAWIGVVAAIVGTSGAAADSVSSGSAAPVQEATSQRPPTGLRLPEGFRRVTLWVHGQKDEVNRIVPSRYIDLLNCGRPGEPANAARVVVQDVKVLAVHRCKGEGNAFPRRDCVGVSLGVTPEQAEKLAVLAGLAILGVRRQPAVVEICELDGPRRPLFSRAASLYSLPTPDPRADAPPEGPRPRVLRVERIEEPAAADIEAAGHPAPVSPMPRLAQPKAVEPFRQAGVVRIPVELRVGD